MPYEKQVRHLDYSRKLLQDISGQDVVSFRAPALRVSALTARALIETGFRIDSSIASQRFDFFLSFGGKQKLHFLTTPRLPYRVNKNNIFKKGQSSLVEIPLSASLFPCRHHQCESSQGYQDPAALSAPGNLNEFQTGGVCNPPQ